MWILEQQQKRNSFIYKQKLTTKVWQSKYTRQGASEKDYNNNNNNNSNNNNNNNNNNNGLFTDPLGGSSLLKYINYN